MSSQCPLTGRSQHQPAGSGVCSVTGSPGQQGPSAPRGPLPSQAGGRCSCVVGTVQSADRPHRLCEGRPGGGSGRSGVTLCVYWVVTGASESRGRQRPGTSRARAPSGAGGPTGRAAPPGSPPQRPLRHQRAGPAGPLREEPVLRPGQGDGWGGRVGRAGPGIPPMHVRRLPGLPSGAGGSGSWELCRVREGREGREGGWWGALSPEAGRAGSSGAFAPWERGSGG